MNDESRMSNGEGITALRCSVRRRQRITGAALTTSQRVRSGQRTLQHSGFVIHSSFELRHLIMVQGCM